MKPEIKQFSSLEKIISPRDMSRPAIESASVLPGQHFSYQVGLVLRQGIYEDKIIPEISLDSALAPYIKLYAVKSIPADFPRPEEADDDYLTDVPMPLPDLLLPLDAQKGYVNFINSLAVIWVELCLPRGFQPGAGSITLQITGRCNRNESIAFETSATLPLEILPLDLPEQTTIYTQWFYADCIALAHKVEIYSPAHWELLDRYIAMAAELGINMLLTPVISPPLDTAPGTFRPCTQLVQIEKKEEAYHFDFTRLRRYIALAKKHGIRYFEMSHFFSQWGCGYTPNIMVTENGEETLLFGWHVAADDPAYAVFLRQLIPALIQVLKEEQIADVSYFHISDEPTAQHLVAYEYAHSLLKPLLGTCKTLDALSDVDFYRRGLVEHPVCANNHIEPFLKEQVPGLWTYYCCAQFDKVSNRFMAMPSYRNRILGLQMYKYGIEGFLQWGYNYYYSQYSLYEINPYVTTSADGIFPSGDPFSVYPGKNGPLPSIRALVFREALEDIELCRLLERKIGRQAVVQLIEQEAGMELTFAEYPRSAAFFAGLTDKIKQLLTEQ